MHLHDTLSHWYATHGRHDLPWRRTDDPYAIYISEIMLQQTQVATVRDRYYAPFLAQFPTLTALAAAPLEDVLKAWEGLGYYTRARNLHRAAQIAAPRLPETVEGLIALPGIGRNTAHAVAAFAYRRAVPVMEANVKRVLHRLHSHASMSERELWEVAGALVNPADPFTHNQAMMDIGALICTPTAPRCGECPLAHACLGKDAPQHYPQAKARRTPPVRERLLLVVTDPQGRLLLRPRASRFLGGLYGFVEVAPGEACALGGRDWPPEALQALPKLGEIRQTYSHFTLQAQVVALTLDAEQAAREPDEHWHRRAELASLPVSRADSKVMALLDAMPRPHGNFS